MASIRQSFGLIILFNILVPLWISSSASAQKQHLFESIEYKQAYRKETRDRSGVPGKNYWQNRSDYQITASFDPKQALIEGHLKITYHNESPDSLNTLVLKLMQNLYKKGSPKQMQLDERLLHDGVGVNNLQIDGKPIDDRSTILAGTVMKVSLPHYISVGSSASIELDFVTPIPKGSGLRSGAIDSTSFFMAYWFPQMAVYDDIFGWDTDEYVGVPENYNDFSSYDVAITLPSQYVIWATGKNTNMKDLFDRDILDRIEQSKKSDEPVMILESSDFKKADGNTKTWKFSAENVPDFAWGTSDHYLWEGVSAHNPDANNTCWIQSAYPVGAKHFDLVASISKTSVEVFSTKFPGVPYPYFKHISFRGTEGGGMEFPMLANNNVAPDTVSTILVTSHELAHNYFPFMMGINERKYGWWDETLTALMEHYVHKKAYPEHRVTGFFNYQMSFNYLAPSHEMLPTATETSNIMKPLPSITNFYVKGPAALDVFMGMVGEEVFYEINRAFMLTWKGKHPTPLDYFYFINSKSEENFNWFWDAWFYSYGYPDLGISHVDQNDQYVAVSISNIGRFPVSTTLVIQFEDGSSHDETIETRVWKGGRESHTVRIPIDKSVSKIILDPSHSYDSDYSNNTYPVK